jgi:hypothetical protein
VSVRRFPDCSAALRALAEGLNDAVCHDFRAIREVVMCDAWHGEGQGSMTPATFRERIEAGWQKVRAACAAHGGTTPEVGFLEPLTTAPEVYEVRRNGAHVGVLTREGAEVTVCLEDTCRAMGGGQDTVDALRSLLEVQGYEVVGP